MNKKLFIIILIIIFFLGAFYSHKQRAPKRKYSDFHCFYVAGQRLLEQENIYVIDKAQKVAEFRYAPIFAVLMSGLTRMDEGVADTIWFILNFCLLIISFICLHKLIITQNLNYKSSLILYTLTILGVLRFILHNFDSGQSNILMMSSILIGLYYISKRREVLGGAMLAFSIMVKYTPLIFIPYFLLKRKIKLSFIIITSTVAYLILPALFIGFKTNLLYLKNLIPFLTTSSILDKITILDPKNQSLLSFFYRIFTRCLNYFHAPYMIFESLKLTDTTINLIFVVSALILYIIILLKSKRIIDYALLLICVALFNLNAWMHNYILLSMGYFIIVHYLIKNSFKDKFVFTFWLLSYILNIITIKSLFGKTFTYKLYFYSPFVVSALFTFIALLKIRSHSHNDV